MLLSVDLGGYPVTRDWLQIAVGKDGKMPPPRPGLPLQEVTSIIVGDSGVSGLTATAARADLGQGYGHFLIDDLKIIEPVPAVTSRLGRTEQANYLALGPGKEPPSAIFVSLCYGGRIERDVAYPRWVGFVAALCERFGLEADAVRTASSLGIGRDDPEPSLRWAGKSIDEYLAAVGARLAVAQVMRRGHQPARPNRLDEAEEKL